jgi:hypothetical protein
MVSAPKLNVTVVPALVIRPGDAVLLNVGAGADLAEWQPVLDQLRARFPEVEFTVLGGVEQIAVKPGQDERVQHFEQELAEAQPDEQSPYRSSGWQRSQPGRQETLKSPDEEVDLDALDPGLDMPGNR